MRRSLVLNALGRGALVLLAFLAASAGTAFASAGAHSKVVAFHGYRIAVPAGWPVYDLSSSPRVCVRFDHHAVYLGRPSSVQDCPAHAVGRTEAILIEPLVARGASATGSRESPLPLVTNSGAQPRQGSSASRVVGSSGVIVTATWGRHPSLVKGALGIRSFARMRSLAEMRGGRGPAPFRARTASAAGAVYTGLGFDACSAPSVSRMSAWNSSPYRAVGIYIGGTNMGCAQPNLTSGWVSAESAAGWHLIPTYVGLQAPGNGCGCSSINPGQASVQGAAAARDASNQAGALGIGPGNPIYFDLEAYSRNPRTTSAVLAFVSAWTSQLHAHGYKSGVYAAGGSGIPDLVGAMGTWFNEPDDIWIAEWNGAQITGSRYVPSGDWSNHQRLHQYNGDHDETYRGVTINVDDNYLDGATAGAGSRAPARHSIPDGTFVRVAGSSTTYRIAGGAPLYLSPQYWNAVAPQPATVISQQQFKALNSVPRDGTFLETPNGTQYRIAGGAPLYVRSAALLATAHPVMIDQWDIDNITNPMAHLNAVPANGTFLNTTTGHIYRVAGGAPFSLRSWVVFGGPRASATIDAWDIANLSNPESHLSANPADGTVVQGLPSRSYWKFAGGTRRLTLAAAWAVKVGDLGLAAYRGIPCVVPKLRHTTLLQVRRALRRADCRLGQVLRPQRFSRRRILHVTRQSPRARTQHAAGHAVTVTLG